MGKNKRHHYYQTPSDAAIANLHAEMAQENEVEFSFSVFLT